MSFLFGWVTKPQLMLSFLDKIIAISEIAILIFSIAFIFFLKENRKIKRIKKKAR